MAGCSSIHTYIHTFKDTYMHTYIQPIASLERDWQLDGSLVDSVWPAVPVVSKLKAKLDQVVAANESEEVCMYVCVFLCMYCVLCMCMYVFGSNFGSSGGCK